VRVPSPRLIRLGSIVGGSIAEPGDGEYSVPGILQPIIELSSPVDKILVSPVADVQNDSFCVFDTIARSGITAGVNRDIVTMKKGLWAFDVTFSGMFTGTTNVVLGSDDGIQFTDPDGAALILFGMPRITGAQQAVQLTLRFAFQRDGWKFTIISFATVAGDNLRLTTALNARRLL